MGSLCRITNHAVCFRACCEFATEYPFPPPQPVDGWWWRQIDLYNYIQKMSTTFYWLGNLRNLFSSTRQWSSTEPGGYFQPGRDTVRGREHESNHIKHLLTTRHQQQQQKLKQSRPPIGIIIVKLLTNPLMFNSPSNCQWASAASHQPVQFAFVDDYWN